MNAVRTVKTLSAALPYIQKFAGKTIVVKYGGNAMTDTAAVVSFCRDIALLSQVGLRVVVVHGGGPQIGASLTKLGVESSFANGLRVTDKATLAVVQMVLLGEVNPELVAMLLKKGAKAIGLSGIDGHLFSARKLKKQTSTNQSDVDLGFVGELTKVRSEILCDLLDASYIPVLAPVGVDTSGQRYNINADTVASKVAQALVAEKVIFMTNAKGVMDTDNNLLTGLSVTDARQLMQDNVIYGGMVPKTIAALEAVSNGVKAAHVIDGRREHALLLELLTDEGVGTLLNA